MERKGKKALGLLKEVVLTDETDVVKQNGVGRTPFDTVISARRFYFIKILQRKM